MVTQETLFARVAQRLAQLTPAEFRARLDGVREHPLVRALEYEPQSARSTALIALEAWGVQMRFGNLLKPDGINTLCWYTVELSGGEVFEFDAQALKETTHSATQSFGQQGIEADIRAAAQLAEQVFPDQAGFEAWVRLHFNKIAFEESAA